MPCCTVALIAKPVFESHNHLANDAVKRRFRYDELVTWFYEYWDTDDVFLLKKHLVLLCDHHTQMSRYYSNQATYEFPTIEYFYDFSEVLSVLHLRQLEKEEQPELSHKLLNTPMGVLMDKAPVQKMDWYDTVINKCIDEFNKATTC